MNTIIIFFGTVYTFLTLVRFRFEIECNLITENRGISYLLEERQIVRLMYITFIIFIQSLFTAFFRMLFICYFMHAFKYVMVINDLDPFKDLSY